MNAIPFHASVRIKLGAGSHIEDKDKNPIGINVSAKIIKNKVATPFRKCEFEIHFGIGIREHEQLFDELRGYGKLSKDGKTFEVAGTGAWKELNVVDDETGEILINKKFTKSQFDKIIKDPQYKQYIDDLCDACFIKQKRTAEDLDIDEDSYEEVKALADELKESVGDLGDLSEIE